MAHGGADAVVNAEGSTGVPVVAWGWWSVGVGERQRLPARRHHGRGHQPRARPPRARQQRHTENIALAVVFHRGFRYLPEAHLHFMMRRRDALDAILSPT